MKIQLFGHSECEVTVINVYNSKLYFFYEIGLVIIYKTKDSNEFSLLLILNNFTCMFITAFRLMEVKTNLQ